MKERRGGGGRAVEYYCQVNDEEEEEDATVITKNKALQNTCFIYKASGDNGGQCLLICSFQLLCLCALFVFVCLFAQRQKVLFELYDLVNFAYFYFCAIYLITATTAKQNSQQVLSTMNISTLCCLSALLLAVASCLLQSAQGLRLRSRVICFNFFSESNRE